MGEFDNHGSGGMSAAVGEGGYSTAGTSGVDDATMSSVPDPGGPPSSSDGGMSAGTNGGYSTSGTSPDSSSADEPAPPEPKDWDEWSSDLTNAVVDEVKGLVVDGVSTLIGIAEGPAWVAEKVLDLETDNPQYMKNIDPETGLPRTAPDASTTPPDGGAVPPDSGPHSSLDDQSAAENDMAASAFIVDLSSEQDAGEFSPDFVDDIAVDYGPNEPIDDMPVEPEILGTGDDMDVTSPAPLEDLEPSDSVPDEDRGCWDIASSEPSVSEVTADAAVHE